MTGTTLPLPLRKIIYKDFVVVNEILVLYLMVGINSEAVFVYVTITQRMSVYLIIQYIRFDYYGPPDILCRLEGLSYQKIYLFFKSYTVCLFLRLCGQNI
jgi:hypothetical protein